MWSHRSSLNSNSPRDVHRCIATGQQAKPSVALLALRRQNEGDDEPVKSKHFGEDKNENHTDEQARLLRCPTHTRVANDADGKSCSQTAQANTETSAEISEAPTDTQLSQPKLSHQKQATLYECTNKKQQALSLRCNNSKVQETKWATSKPGR